MSPTAVPAVEVPDDAAGVGEEDHFGAAGAAELHPVAVRQPVLGHRLAVDERAVARAAVLEDQRAVLADDLGVLARDVAAHQPHVALGAAADRQRGLVDGNDAAAEAIVDFEAGVSHGSAHRS